MDIVFMLFLLVLFIGLSAFFSSSESALTAASRARMHMLEQDGDRGAATVNRIMAHKDRLIGAILLGNTLGNTLLAAIAGSVMTGMFGDAGIYYATIFVTAALLIFGEVLPKTYALYHADSLARVVAFPMSIIVLVSMPITAAVTWIVNMILWLCGIKIEKGHKGSDVEELRGAIEMHIGDEAMQERRAMLRSIMDLSHIRVDEIMIHRKNVNMVSVDQPVADAIAKILDFNHSRIPVWSDRPENIIGIVHMKTLLFALNDVQGDAGRIDLRALLSPARFIPDSITLLDQLQSFRVKHEHFAVVVDEYGTFMGIVTLEDILEEIVGDIEDEQDLVVPGVRRMPDGSYLVNGDIPIRDLNRELNWSLPANADYSTAAGLVIYESQSIPGAGQTFVYHGYQFDVIKKQRNQITVLKIIPVV